MIFLGLFLTQRKNNLDKFHCIKGVWETLFGVYYQHRHPQWVPAWGPKHKPAVPINSAVSFFNRCVLNAHKTIFFTIFWPTSYFRIHYVCLGQSLQGNPPNANFFEGLQIAIMETMIGRKNKSLNFVKWNLSFAYLKCLYIPLKN